MPLVERTHSLTLKPSWDVASPTSASSPPKPFTRSGARSALAYAEVVRASSRRSTNFV